MPDDRFEDFKLATPIRMLVIGGAAGALVGFTGEPLTEGNIAATTGATEFLGGVAECLIEWAQRELERREYRTRSGSRWMAEAFESVIAFATAPLCGFIATGTRS